MPKLFPPTLLMLQQQFSGQSFHHKWMHEKSSETFHNPHILSLANVSDNNLTNRPRMPFNIKLYRNPGKRKILHFLQRDHSIDKNPKFHQNWTTHSCKIHVDSRQTADNMCTCSNWYCNKADYEKSYNLSTLPIVGLLASLQLVHFKQCSICNIDSISLV